MLTKVKVSATFLLVAASLVSANGHSADMPTRTSVCFTPAKQCEPLIVKAIDSARDTIKVQAYGFTSQPIIHALQRAAGRGVEVLAILDKINERRYSGATLLEAAGIPVWIDGEPAIAHNKTIIIDSHLVIGGSFNYTASAERRNAENVLFMDSPPLAEQFIANWKSRLTASREFDPRMPEPEGGAAEQ